MEWALAIPSLQGTTEINGFLTGKKAAFVADIKEMFEERFGTVRFTRLYYGQEFCEKAISGKEDMKRAFNISEEEGLSFSYVTPYVTETGLTKLKIRLDKLAAEKPDSEVVINDWGVLDWLNDQQLTLTPVLGRLMNKILRDPRMPNKSINTVNSQTADCLRTSFLTGVGMKNLLDQYHVRRIELDHPPQGLDPKLSDWGYQSSLYLPYGVVTTGRICLMQSWGLEDKDRFKAAMVCDQKCGRYWLEMSDPSGKVKNTANWKLMQKGNTIFYRQSRKFAVKALEQAVSYGISRIVFQPEPL
ncbi:hypothetical protein Desor_2856 [Desulfosporosinus orientis DSM 765]|uniref:Uncharacterized protein n=1 Tax=Desulfosporosinus orientis (strain ATCC 19365 / DSM 765 / NCIMB 8382 / VKM B-1628 / Singapore I) TaxID=768706 RepID=G7WDR1_DESOD|nr:hypothetical protein [Desulfosporosinus orientis]AET68386.1 hypothetical protein Desor_2856 [Desulfosporosinus orientis DSM 765]